ncbi:MAG TPA: hypothetical protein VE907_10415 [Gammaproteobacteria bacterium]|nr:hypothetical protein [Gammaproteobacteria bacterium]
MLSGRPKHVTVGRAIRRTPIAVLAAVLALPCFGQSLLAPRPCSEAATLRSAGGTAAASLTFDNVSTYDVRVWWIDPQGSSRAVVDVAAGRTVQLTTNRDHVFVVRTTAGACVGVYAVTLNNAAVRLTPMLFAARPPPQPSVDAPAAVSSAAEPPTPLEQALTAAIEQAFERADIDPAGVELEVQSVRTYSRGQIAERQRLAFSIGYTIAHIQAHPSNADDTGLAEPLDRLLAQLPPSAQLRQAATSWLRAKSSNDLGVFGLAEELQRVFDADMSESGPPEDVFAPLGELAYLLQAHAHAAFELAAKDGLYRATQDSQYRDGAKLLRLVVADGRSSLPSSAASAARLCRRVVAATMCREDVAAAIEGSGRLIGADRTDDAERALQPLLAELLIR